MRFLTSLPARMPHVSIPYGGRSVFGFAIFSNSATRFDGSTTLLSAPKLLLDKRLRFAFSRFHFRTGHGRGRCTRPMRGNSDRMEMESNQIGTQPTGVAVWKRDVYLVQPIFSFSNRTIAAGNQLLAWKDLVDRKQIVVQEVLWRLASVFREDELFFYLKPRCNDGLSFGTSGWGTVG